MHRDGLAILTIGGISPQQVPDGEDAVDDGLVDDVDLQGMAADEIQRGNALPGHGENALSADPVQEEAGEKQENPREQGEIIGGVESRMREAEIGGQVVAVECIGEGGQGMEEDADGALRDEPCQGKEGKADGQPDPPGNAQQQGLCGACQEHARANAGEDAEDDQILPHEQERYEGNGQPEGEDDGAAAEGMPSHGGAEAGQSDEGAADGLLPDEGACPEVPGGMDAEDVDEIPHGMEEHHIDDGQPAQGIEEGAAGAHTGGIGHAISSFVMIPYYYTGNLRRCQCG